MALNLYTAADGLLGTHVTWEDIQTELQDYFKTEATFGDDKSAANLSYGKIASLMNGVDIVEQLRQAGLPTPMAREEENQHLQKTCQKVHNIECDLYEFVKKDNLQTQWMPNVIAMKSFDENNALKGYIVMDYIQSDDVNLSDNVLKAVAKYSAIGNKMDEATVNKFQMKLFSKVFGPMIKEQTKKDAVESLRKFDNGSLADIIDDYEKVYMEAVTVEKITEMDHLAETFGIQQTLVHGDLWSANLMWKKQEHGEMQLKAIVDYQFAHFNCAALDLARLMMSTLSGKDRREHYEEIIETYYKLFIEELGDSSAPFTLEQLKDATNVALPYAGMFIAPVIQPLYEIVSAQNTEDKEPVLERIREKVRCIIEDSTHYYQKYGKTN
ncbi:hypothetical protein WR25_00855 [Diploscapter pachys]|uniref:CHK kinase-like domain-containing protein n=1 Tax=Diploscapter pachys TaxID=2018661 RepID=A0A2A2L5M3_9BILA|nr:hypothetical protein WR25_00855 [Diploscapter pachys]